MRAARGKAPVAGAMTGAPGAAPDGATGPARVRRSTPPAPGRRPVSRVDVVVVGGGIHGAGVAQAAAAAGHGVLLLERRAIASGTSSRSSGLIHGGLRYLESAQLGLVRESLRERRRLLARAPDLVRLQRFHIPVYRETRRRPWQIALGLSAYALLGGLRAENRFTHVPRRCWERLDGLRTDGLEAVLCYLDGETDDAALTRAVAASARRLGARIAVPAELVGAELGSDRVRVRYRMDGRDRECEARVLVNAAGPWVAEVAARVTPAIALPPIELVQGAHLWLPGTLGRGVYYLESRQDGRAVFVIPRAGGICVGTTETPFGGRPEEARPLEREQRYLLDVLRAHFPALDYGLEDVRRATAGLRVLPAGPGDAFHRSREVSLVPDRRERPRVLSLCGGKLTTHAATAAKVVRRLQPSLPPRARIADPRRLPLTPQPP